MSRYLKVAKKLVAEGWDMSPNRPKLSSLIERFNGLRWILRDYGAFEPNTAETFWQILKRAVKKMSFPNIKPEDWGLNQSVKRWPLAARKLTEAAKNIFGQVRAAPEEELQSFISYYGEERLASMNRFEKIASRVVSSNPVQEAAEVAFEIIDGMDGIISERGEEELWRYWKQDVLKRWDALVGKKVNRDYMVSVLHDLIDGLEGYASEQGDETRYWKSRISNLLRKAKAAERKLKML